MKRMHASKIDTDDFGRIDRFSPLGCCVFSLVVLLSGGITAWLILAVVPWTLDYPIPARAYVPLAAVGAAVPLGLFLIVCKVSKTARRLFFKRNPELLTDAESRKPD